MPAEPGNEGQRGRAKGGLTDSVPGGTLALTDGLHHIFHTGVTLGVPTALQGHPYCPARPPCEQEALSGGGIAPMSALAMRHHGGTAQLPVALDGPA